MSRRRRPQVIEACGVRAVSPNCASVASAGGPGQPLVPSELEPFFPNWPRRQCVATDGGVGATSPGLPVAVFTALRHPPRVAVAPAIEIPACFVTGPHAVRAIGVRAVAPYRRLSHNGIRHRRGDLTEVNDGGLSLRIDCSVGSRNGYQTSQCRVRAPAKAPQHPQRPFEQLKDDRPYMARTSLVNEA